MARHTIEGEQNRSGSSGGMAKKLVLGVGVREQVANILKNFQPI